MGGGEYVRGFAMWLGGLIMEVREMVWDAGFEPA